MSERPRLRPLLLLIAITSSIALVSCGQRAETDAAAVPEATTAAEPESTASPATTSKLAGTRWRLSEIQSMDDAIGTTRPEEPSLYTLSFGEDGTLSMRLNCNRATASWSATPAEGGDSGSLTIGPMAMTRALCPPPSLDERIARDMGYVRGFMLRDGFLSLSLMADGGIYLWEPDMAGEETAAASGSG